MSQDRAHHLEHCLGGPAVLRQRLALMRAPFRSRGHEGQRVCLLPSALDSRRDITIRHRGNLLELARGDPVREKLLTQTANRVTVPLRPFQLIGGSIDPLIVGVGMAHQALDLENDQLRRPPGANRRHDPGQRLEAAHRISPVEPADRHTEEMVGFAAPCPRRERGLARGPGRDGKTVIFNHQKQRQLGPDRLAQGLQHLALLRGTLAHAAQDQRTRRLPPSPQFGRDSHGLQHVVTHRSSLAQNLERTVARHRGHLPPFGLRSGGAEQVLKERVDRHSACQEQGLGAIVQVQPIVVLEQ